jgi:hypothetical protein
MDIISVDFTLSELSLLRQSLDMITINGKDAKLVASLQTKLEEAMIALPPPLQDKAKKQL